jgi:SPX domain protein involved in polyphosphate accumulation
MSLSGLSKPQIMIFYEIATRVWKYRGVAIQKELLHRIVKEDYQKLEWTGAMPPKETSFFQSLPEDTDFRRNPYLIDIYLEFLNRISEFETECDAELQKIDSERREREKERQVALKKWQAEQADKNLTGLLMPKELTNKPRREDKKLTSLYATATSQSLTLILESLQIQLRTRLHDLCLS